MFDRRVCRGSNYPHRAPIAIQPASTQRRSPGRRHSGHGLAEGPRPATQTPEPVPGREHIEVQTLTYLEVLEQRSPDHDQSQQTDPLLDYPDSPRYVPKQGGEHKGTQIEAGDLFDFDLEVEPLLEVLTGKTLDLAVIDVLDETEQTDLVARRDQFEQMRNVELAETQRIEARETRLFEEKQRRKQQEKERIQRETELATKLAARTVSKTTLEALKDRVLNQLQANGHFQDPLLAQVNVEFMPWLVKQTGDRVHVAVNAGKMIEAVVVDAVACAHETDLSIASARRALLKQKHDEAVALQAERERAVAAEANATTIGAQSTEAPNESAPDEAQPESDPVAGPAE